MPNTPISNYLRNSEAKTARRFREWAEGRDLDRMVDAVQMVIGMAVVVIVFLAIAIGATISFPGVR